MVGEAALDDEQDELLEDNQVSVMGCSNVVMAAASRSVQRRGSTG
jgi:hypothetical protein